MAHAPQLDANGQAAVGSAIPWRSPLGRGRAVDHERATEAAREFLVSVGIGPSSETVRDTPERMVRCYAELLTLRPFQPTTFPNEERYDELVMARAIPCAVGLRASHAPVHRCCRGQGRSSSTSSACRAGMGSGGSAR